MYVINMISNKIDIHITAIPNGVNTVLVGVGNAGVLAACPLI